MSVTVFCNFSLKRPVTLFESYQAVPLVLVKMFIFIIILVVIESSLAKLRLFRITEFLGSAFVTSLIAVIIQLLET